MGPSPGKPGHLPRPACAGASTCQLDQGLGDQTGLQAIGEFCHRNTLAREGVTKRELSLPAITSRRLRMSRVEMLTKVWAELRPYASPTGLPEGAHPWFAARPVRCAASHHTKPEIEIRPLLRTTLRSSGCAPPMRIQGGI